MRYFGYECAYQTLNKVTMSFKTINWENQECNEFMIIGLLMSKQGVLCTVELGSQRLNLFLFGLGMAIIYEPYLLAIG